MTTCGMSVARIVCADLDEIRGSGVHSIAEQVQELSGAIDDTLTRHGLNRVIGTGLGEFLIRDAVERLDGARCSFVSGMYGEDVSKVFPAYAVAKLAEFG